MPAGHSGKRGWTVGAKATEGQAQPFHIERVIIDQKGSERRPVVAYAEVPGLCECASWRSIRAMAVSFFVISLFLDNLYQL